MSRTRIVVTATLVALAAMLQFASANHAGASRLAGHPATIFNQVLPKLRGTHVPVYLPAWMPRYRRRIYPSAGLDQGGAAYFVNLSTSPHGGDAALVFWMTAQPGPGDDTGRRVPLGHGITGILDLHSGGNEGPTIFWRLGKTGYTIGGMATQRQLLRASRSIVQVR